jgi:hypothetical protein
MKSPNHGQAAPENRPSGPKAVTPQTPVHLPDLSHRFIAVQRGEPITTPNDLCDVVRYAAERAASMLECLVELYAHDGRLAPALDAVRFEVLDIGAVVEAWRRNVSALTGGDSAGGPGHD